jgi:hypothetical protein
MFESIDWCEAKSNLVNAWCALEEVEDTLNFDCYLNDPNIDRKISALQLGRETIIRYMSNEEVETLYEFYCKENPRETFWATENIESFKKWIGYPFKEYSKVTYN